MRPGYYRKPPDSAATRHLFVANCGPAAGIELEAARQLFTSLGCEAFSTLRGSICCATFADERAAVRAKLSLESERTAAEYKRVFKVRFAEYISEPSTKEERHVFRDSEGCGVPGLYLFKDFVTEKEEEELVAHVDAGVWESLASRRVQHYGYRFEYKTRNVDTGRRAAAFPAPAAAVAARLRLLPDAVDADQLTVNEYAPGVGLAPHIDTHSAFTGAIAALSLGGSCVMEMRRGEERVALFLPPRSLLLMSGAARYAWQHYIPHRKSDLVDGEAVQRAPRRVSFTFRQVRGFACDCEYPEHCDSQSGSLPPTRLQQLTLRKSDHNDNGILTGLGERHDASSELANSTAAGRLASAAEGRDDDRNAAAGCSASSRAPLAASLEQQHVHAVYETIAGHFSSTRFAVWPKVRAFLDSLPAGAVVVDVGCGNGKYFAARPDLAVLGSDRSSGLAAHAAQLCRSPAADDSGQSATAAAREAQAGSSGDAKCAHIGRALPRAPRADVIVADALSLPYKDGCSDAALSIAVIHHVGSVARRLRLLEEMVRVLRVGGTALVTVWAAEQEDAGKLSKWQPISSQAAQGNGRADSQDAPASGGDYLVPWHVPFHRASAAAVVRAACAQSDEETLGGGAVGGHVDAAKASVVYQRYYHLFATGELEGLVAAVPSAKLVASFYDKSNWCCIVRKQAAATGLAAGSQATEGEAEAAVGVAPLSHGPADSATHN